NLLTWERCQKDLLMRCMRIGGAYALIEQTATRDDYMEGLKLTDAEYQVVVSLRRHPILTKVLAPM
ncbi:hypothetical protein, partial [Xanthomonas citri]|uniref:hypothetical protein n=1 Tax=Xanthomonas citri TaxID=346 RepID=UPI00058B7697